MSGYRPAEARLPRAVALSSLLGALLSSWPAAAPAAPPAAPLDPGPKVGYENFEAPGRFTNTVQSNGNTIEWLGRGAGEPSIGVNWNSPAPNNAAGVTNFQSDLQTLFVTFNDACPAGGQKATWINRPAPTSQGVDSDPIGFTDRVTGRVFAAELTLLTPTCKISYSDDDGVTWVPTTGPGGSGVDHQTIGGGPYHEIAAGVPPPYANPSGSAFYYCSQDIAAAYCLRSDDGGLSWQQGTQMYTLATCGGLHGHVKVSPFDGTVYVPNADCGSGVGALAVSTDNGTTWTVRNVTSGALTTGGSNSDPAVGIDKAGKVYFANATQVGTTRSFLTVATSTNQGVSWQNMYDLTTQFGLNNIRYPAAIGGDAGRAAIAFYGTTTSGDADGRNAFWGVWHLYVAHTFDGGASWTVTDATPNQPMQRGCIWTQGGGDICRNLLDFFDIAIDKQGRVQVGYVNGCQGGSCAQAAPTAKGNDYSATATIARQSSGRRLLASVSVPSQSVPGIPSLTARRVGTVVHLQWSEGDTGNSAITGYQILRGTASGGEQLLATVDGTTTNYDDTTATDWTRTYYYEVVAVNALGASCPNNEQAVPYVGDTCPGIVIHQNDPLHMESAPVQNGANPQLAIEWFSVGEPIGPLKLANGTVTAAAGTYLKFTMKVHDLASIPPASRWRMVWDTYASAGQLFYVGMRSDDTSAVTFDYGRVGDAGLPAVLVLSETKVGNAFPQSNFKPDGTITIYVPKTGVGNPPAGDLLGALGAKTFTGDTSGTQNYQRSTALVDHTFVKGVTDNAFPGTAYLLRDAAHWQNNHLPVAAMTANGTLCVESPSRCTQGHPPLTVNFDASASSDSDGDIIPTYLFDFGDSSSTTVTVPAALATHIYNTPGRYTVTMTPTDSCGLVADPVSTWNINVLAPPIAALTATPNAIVKGNSVALDASGSTDPNADTLVEYRFTPGDGSADIVGAANNTSHIYMLGGSYTASVLVKDATDDVSVSPATAPVTVTNTAPVADLLPASASGLAHLTVNFDASGSTDADSALTPDHVMRYDFDFKDGNTATSLVPAVSHTFDQPGTYMVEVTVFDEEGQPSGSAATSTITVLNNPPVALLSALPATQGKGRLVTLDGSASSDVEGPLMYQFDFGDGASAPSSSASSVNHGYAISGTYTVTLTVTDLHGATATATKQVTITNSAPIAMLTPSANEVLPGDSVAFSGAGSGDPDPNDHLQSYTFDFGDGSTPVTQTSANTAHTYDKGVYTATLVVKDSEGAVSAPATTTIVASSGDNTNLFAGGPMAPMALAVLGLLGALRRGRARR